MKPPLNSGNSEGFIEGIRLTSFRLDLQWPRTKNVFEQLTDPTVAMPFAVAPVKGARDMLAACAAAARSPCRACGNWKAVLKRSAGQ